MIELLTVSEIAEKLRISKATIRAWTRQGMPATRLGRRLVRFTESDVLTWLAASGARQNGKD